MADRANVERLKPVIRKQSVIVERALARRSSDAAAMSDAALEEELAKNWRESLAWEVTRRLYAGRVAELRAREPGDDVATADAEIEDEKGRRLGTRGQ